MKHFIAFVTIFCVLTIFGFKSIDANFESTTSVINDSESEVYSSFRVNDSSNLAVSEVLTRMENGEDMSMFLTQVKSSKMIASNPCIGPRLFCVNNSIICKPQFHTLFVYRNLCDPSVILSICSNKKPKCRYSN